MPSKLAVVDGAGAAGPPTATGPGPSATSTRWMSGSSSTKRSSLRCWTECDRDRLRTSNTLSRPWVVMVSGLDDRFDSGLVDAGSVDFVTGRAGSADAFAAPTRAIPARL